MIIIILNSSNALCLKGDQYSIRKTEVFLRQKLHPSLHNSIRPSLQFLKLPSGAIWRLETTTNGNFCDASGLHVSEKNTWKEKRKKNSQPMTNKKPKDGCQKLNKTKHMRTVWEKTSCKKLITVRSEENLQLKKKTKFPELKYWSNRKTTHDSWLIKSTDWIPDYMLQKNTEHDITKK